MLTLLNKLFLQLDTLCFFDLNVENVSMYQQLKAALRPATTAVVLLYMEMKLVSAIKDSRKTKADFVLVRNNILHFKTV